jgi:hypothetical protein
LCGKILFWGKSKVSNCRFRADTFCQGGDAGSDGRCRIIFPGAMNFCGGNDLRVRPTGPKMRCGTALHMHLKK